MKVYFSTLNSSKIHTGGIREIIDDLASKNVRALEISSGHRYEKGFFKELVSAKKRGMYIMLHNYSPPEPSGLLLNLSDPDKTMRERSVAFMQKSIDLTKKLGFNYYAIHGGFSGYNYKIGEDNTKNKFITKKLARKYFIDNLKKVVRRAEKQNINIGFENHVIEKGNEQQLITAGISEIAEVFETIKSNRLFLHLDVGHLNVTANTLKFNRLNFLKKFRNKIYATQISKNNGKKDEHLPINKDLWILPHLKTFQNLCYPILETKGPITKKSVREHTNIINSFL